MIDEIEIEETLRRNHPSLQVDTLCLIIQDIFGATYLINSSHYFKFSTCLMESNSIQTMVNLLPKLSQQVNVTLPRVDYSGVLPRNGLHYMGVTAIPGEAMTPEYFNSLEQSQQNNIIQTMAEFLNQCHRLTPAMAFASGVRFTRRSWSASRFLARHNPECVKDLNALFSREELKEIVSSDKSEHEGKSITDVDLTQVSPHLLQFKLSLLHNDFREDHVYIDQKSADVTGIIDFGNVALGDPFDDFVLLWLRMGECFVERLLTYYQAKDPAILLAQLKHRDQLFG